MSSFRGVQKVLAWTWAAASTCLSFPSLSIAEPCTLLWYLAALREPRDSTVFLTRSFIFVFSQTRLLSFLELPGPNQSPLHVNSLTARLRSVAGATCGSRMWQESEIIVQNRKQWHNFPPAPEHFSFWQPVRGKVK